MDMKSLEHDVEKALGLLPADLVIGILNVVLKHFHVLPSLVPQLVPLLAPHVSAGVLETQTGLLSTAELSATLMPVLQRYMAKHANP